MVLSARSKKAAAPAGTESAKPQAAAALPVSSPEEPPAAAGPINFPKAFGRRTGDLDEIAKSRNIRALVLINTIGFLCDKGHPQGMMYEGLEELEKFANQKLKTGKLKIKFTYIAYKLAVQ